MTAIDTAWFFHPSILFLVTAALLPWFTDWEGRNKILFIAPLVAIAVVFSQTWNGDGQGLSVTVPYLGTTLKLVRVDTLSLVFANVFAIQSFIGFIYAYHEKDPLKHIATCLYVAGAFGCVFAGDYLTLFIFWELMSIASTGVIWLARNPAATRAGLRYFLFHIMGGLLLLGGMLMRWKALGTYDFIPADPSNMAVYDWLIMAGFCVNAAAVPLHAWLPDAYPRASITGAVFLSAFTTKTAVYVLARAFAGVELLAIIGVVMCLYGVFYATIENNARKILSYHIVSQVGYMVAGIGIGTAMTMNGACAHAYAHILYKGLLFMGTGCLLYAAGTAKLTELGGLASRIPFVMLFYMVGAVSISGMPLFNGFVTKTMTIAGAAEAHHQWMALGMELAAVGTFLSVGIKLPYFAFWSKPDSTVELKPIPMNMYIAMGISSFLCLFIGLFPSTLYSILPFEVDYQPYTAWHVLQSSLLLAFTGLGFYLCRKVIVPHDKVNLDFDALYRFVGRWFYKLVSVPAAAIDGIWTEVYAKIGLRGLMGFAWLSAIFDRKGIDTIVDGTAYTVKGTGSLAAKGQTGRLQDYIAATAILCLVIFALFWYFI